MKVCKALFEYLEIELNGDCFFCCSNRVALNKIGNIYESTFDEIWNSEKAIKMREEALKGKYPYCNRNNCQVLSGKDINEPLDYYQPKMQVYPSRVAFSISQDCNAKCIFCRDKVFVMPDNQIEYFRERYLQKCLPILKKTKIIFIGDSEEPFASRLAIEVIKNVTDNYPDIKFQIQTNGMLATKEKIQELKLEDKICVFNVSINAATAKTHSRIFRVPQSLFAKLKENLDYVYYLRQHEKIDDLVFNFVVNSYNYKEMLKFIKFAEKYNAGVNFWAVRNYKPDVKIKYEDIAVHLPRHKEYKKLKKILANKAFDSVMVNLYPCLKSIREEALKEKSQNIWNKIIRKIKGETK